MPTVRIEPNYKVTIPKAARAFLGLKIGEEVETMTSKDSITFRKAKTARSYTPTPRELAAIRKGREEIRRGEYLSIDEFFKHLDVDSQHPPSRAKNSQARSATRPRAIARRA